jgi:hypothetical protein
MTYECPRCGRSQIVDNRDLIGRKIIYNGMEIVVIGVDPERDDVVITENRTTKAAPLQTIASYVRVWVKQSEARLAGKPNPY